MTPEAKARAAAKRKERHATDPEYRALIQARNHAQYVKNRERRIEYARQYAEANKEIRAARNRAQRADPVAGAILRARDLVRYREHREERLERQRRDAPRKRLKQHRLTQEQHNTMLAAQLGACAICRQPFASTPRIDHDHRTGEVRGLLCHHCNVTLGHARDDVRILWAAIDYLTAVDDRREARIKRALFAATDTPA